MVSDKILNNVVSGLDNRDINDDGAAQKLSCSDIMDLKEQGASPETILETIVENSATFASKTEYSQVIFFWFVINCIIIVIFFRKST